MRLLPVIAILTGCTPDVLEARKLPAEVAGDAHAAVEANNAFACDLYATLGGGASPPRNLFLSPFSISTVLAMLDAGAAGNTDVQLRAALHATIASDAMNAAYRALLASLGTGTGYGGYTLQTADRLFGQQGVAFLPAYLTTTGDDYGAALMPVDFAGDKGGAIDTIDRWVSDHTGGKIPTLFDPGDLDASTQLVAVNAIHFQGTWSAQFDRSSTRPGPFHRADGTTVTVPLMHKRDAVALASIPNGRLGVLPFRGKDLSMIILLPDAPDGLQALEAQLTGANLDAWLAAPRSSLDADRDVTLPKFGITSTFDLASALGSLGVVDAFDPAAADFSGIDGQRDLQLQRVRHEALVIVDEQGAEAEAATGDSAIKVVVAPQPFTVDHPFLFLIRDEVTGAVLFIGRMADPSP